MEYLKTEEASRGEVSRSKLNQAIYLLEQAHTDLIQAIHNDQGMPLWTWTFKEAEEARQAVCIALQSFAYQDDQSPHDSLLCPALLGASKTTLTIVQQANIARERLKAALQEAGSIQVRIQDPSSGETLVRSLARVVLGMLGHARLNQRQATRQLISLPHPPIRVAYSWANIQRVGRTTATEVIRQLTARSASAPEPLVHVLEDEIKRLAHLAPDTPLAIKKSQPKQPRVNITWHDAQGQINRKQYYAPAPLFYPSRVGAPLPSLRPLPEHRTAAQHRGRSDIRLEPEPLLPRLGLYQYQPGYKPG